MSDTIELLDAIGRDASLRHASAEELAGVLEQVQASTSLKAAVAAGDIAGLTRELGGKLSDPPPPNQLCPPAEEDEEQEEEEAEPRA